MATITKGSTACGVVNHHHYTVKKHNVVHAFNWMNYPLSIHACIIIINEHCLNRVIAYTKLGVQPSAWTWMWGNQIPLPLPVWYRARQLLQPSRRKTLGRSTAGGQTRIHREVGHQQWTLQWGRWSTDISVKYSCWWEFGSAYQQVASCEGNRNVKLISWCNQASTYLLIKMVNMNTRRQTTDKPRPMYVMVLKVIARFSGNEVGFKSCNREVHKRLWFHSFRCHANINLQIVFQNGPIVCIRNLFSHWNWLSLYIQQCPKLQTDLK